MPVNPQDPRLEALKIQLEGASKALAAMGAPAQQPQQSQQPNPNAIPMSGGYVATPTVKPNPNGSLQGTMTTPQTQAPQAPQVPQTNGVVTPITSGGFKAILGQVQDKLKYNNNLMTQRATLIKHLFDSPLTPQQAATLPPDQQSLVARGDKNAIELQIRLLNDQLQGRANTLDSSVKYLTEAYTADLEAAEQKKAEAEKTMQWYLSTYGDSVVPFLKTKYPELSSQIDGLAGVKTLTQMDREADEAYRQEQLSLDRARLDLDRQKAVGGGGSTTPGAYVDVNGKPLKLTASQVDTLASYDTSKESADHALELLNQGAQSGPVSGRTLEVKKLFGTQDPMQVQLEQTLASLKSSFMKSLSGAAVSEAEVKRLSAFLPSITDQESVVRSKLDSIKRESDRGKSVFLKTVGGVQTVSNDVTTNMAVGSVIEHPPGSGKKYRVDSDGEMVPL
jgi:hypothetical protein